MPDTAIPNRVRIGLAPYAASVNAGAYGPRVTNVAGTECVYERGGAQAFTDARPAVGRFLGALPATRPNGSRYCPTAKVEPLTADKRLLKANINTYRADGSTAGHIGAAWVRVDFDEAAAALQIDLAYEVKATGQAATLGLTRALP